MGFYSIIYKFFKYLASLVFFYIYETIQKYYLECWCSQYNKICVCLISVFYVAGEMLSVAEQFLEQQMHPTVVISAYRQALDDMLNMLKEIR